MRTYESKTGYIRNTKTGECLCATIVYLSKWDDETTYEDISKETYEAWEEEQRRKYGPVE
jgi:hypothetical protein